MILNKILALADIHIFNSKRFNEHEIVFNQLEQEIKKEKPDLILILGDVIDSKNKLSPEQIVLTRKLFIMLSNYARVGYILGNHDRSLQTDNRLDSLSTIVNTIEQPQNEIIYMEKSEVYDLGYSNCKFAVWSWAENNKSPIIPKSDDYIIGLYHGVIDGAITKDGHKLSGGIKLSEFDNCNIVIAGDIHNKTGFRNGEINYVSSLLQVSVNEDARGSYLIYDWNKDKGTFDMSRKLVSNHYAVETIFINEHDKLANLPDDIKFVRLKYDTDFTNRKEIKKIAKTLEENLGIKVTTFPVIKKKTSFVVENKDEQEKKSINYFEEFLKLNKDRLKLNDKRHKALLDLNNTFKTNNELDFEPGDFNIKSLRINNLLSFGNVEDTIIDFNKDGLIGILGKNRAGKSSIIKILQFVLFAELPANSVLFSFLNKHNKDKVGFGEVIFEKNGRLYKVNRSITPKKGKKADGGIQFFEINEEGEEVNDLNKETKTITDKEIRKYIGINDYFEMLSIFSAQKKQVEFIDCKNAERLSLLNKFLNLQEYEEKEEQVKKKVKIENEILKSKILQYDKEYNVESLEQQLDEKRNEVKDLKEDIGRFESKLSDLKPIYEKYKEIWYINSELALGDSDKAALEADFKDLNQELTKLQQICPDLENKANNLKEDLVKKTESLEDIEKQYESAKQTYCSTYNLNRFEFKKKDISGILSEIKFLKKTLDKLEEQYNQKQCTVCNADISLEVKEKINVEILSTIDKINELLLEENKVSEEDNKKEKTYNEILDHYTKIINQNKQEIETLKSEYYSKVNKHKSGLLEISNIQNKINTTQSKIDKVNDVIKAKQTLLDIKDHYQEVQNEIETLDFKLKSSNASIKEIEVVIKYTLEKIENAKLLKQEINKKEEELVVLKTYAEVVSKKGLPLYVLNQNIDSINNKINEIVSQIFDFELSFNINEEKGEATISFIYPDDNEASEVTLASGSETFLINLCVKVGLSQISQLPKVNTLFIDEGYDVLDEESILKLPNIFDVLKNYYQNIFTIVHLNEVKSILDLQINLKKEKGYTVIE